MQIVFGNNLKCVVLSLTLLYTGEGLPPSYQSSVAQKDGDTVGLSEIKQKIADLETIIQKNSQKMQQELASNFQKQFDALRRLFEEGFQQGIQEGLSEKKM